MSRSQGFAAYLATDAEKGAKWQAIYDRVHLTSDQERLVKSFVREINVLVVSGIWCGDCVQQGPLLARIAEVNDCINLRWIDRDLVPELMSHVSINAGARVPVAIFMAEDGAVVSVFGDRSLTRYRAIAARTIGPHCQVPGAPVDQDELEATLQDWLNEFERVHLLLRLSGRLREKYRD